MGFRRILVLSCLLLYFVNFASGGHIGDCPNRNRTSAMGVGRRCRKQCRPGDTRCRGGKVCLCDHECGYSCIKLDNFCPHPPTLLNSTSINITRTNASGIVQAEAPYRYNDRARYICDAGFTLVQDGNHMCHGRRGWTGTSICARNCGQYDPVLVRRRGMVCGTECHVDSQCSNGLQCLCDGACGLRCANSSNDCGEAPQVRNATLQYTGEGLGRVANYICDSGFYRSSGSYARRCTVAGTWDGTSPTCTRVECPDPSEAIGMTDGYIADWVGGPYYPGQQFTFECPSGYRLIGSPVRSCQTNGRWSGVPNACDRQRRTGEVRCSHPGIPVNGELFSGGRGRNRFSVGSTVTFRCHGRYILVGQAVQTCMRFLQWDGQGAPQCIDPIYPDDPREAAQRLSENTNRISVHMSTPSSGVGGRSITADHEGGNEIYFLIDFSRSVTDEALDHSLKFAQKLVTRFAGGTNKTAHYGVIIFASEPKVELNSRINRRLNSTQIIQYFIRISQKKQEIRQTVGGGTNTGAALNVLRGMLGISYQTDRINNGGNNRQRHCFILTDGKSNHGDNPVNIVNIILREFQPNPPQFYSITSCTTCRGNTPDARAEYTQLLGLAGGKLENFVQIENFYLLEQYIDRVIDVRIDYGKCGQAGDIGSIKTRARFGRVLNGETAVDKAWPWQGVFTKKVNGGNFQQILKSYSTSNFLGGGSLINNQWVLTAAHLFAKYDEGNAAWQRNFRVTFGLYNRPITRSHYRNRLDPTMVVYNTEKIIYHPDFDDISLDNDTALVKLGQQVKLDPTKTRWINVPNTFGWVNFTDYIRPVCLPCMPNNCLNSYLRTKGRIPANSNQQQICDIETAAVLDVSNSQNIAVVTGFGHENERSSNDLKLNASATLKQGVLKLMPHATCRDFTNQWGKDLTQQMVCATSSNSSVGIDACRGDSGGPLIRELYDENTRKSCWIQMGIVSWGYGCGKKTTVNGVNSFRPGIFTKLPLFMAWVNQTMEGN
uniref:C3/C5 convertase n=1 Tax=Ciona intestinalis TaxID=7719 RepID=Q5H875_CIOIN|nr:complement factor B-2 precursor [Ciona intestinalis]BAD89300.1 complement factor B-2 [Ciona intestinalis]|eukprot:NP_001029011.1 complement factor B-2 precursor [Ciona intestinalis]